jgi:hypothetical protein
VAHRTVRCTTGQPLFMSGARSPSYSGANDRCRFVAVGAPNTVRCTPDSPVPLPTVMRATRRPWIARPTVALAAVGSPDSPVHHRTVRWIIVVRRQILPRAACSPEFSLAHRTLSDAPPDSSVHHRTVQCARPSWTLVVPSQVICNSFLLFSHCF